jgi:hypothetical protein
LVFVRERIEKLVQSLDSEYEAAVQNLGRSEAA